MDNFKETISFKTTDIKVYEALTNAIKKWWTEKFEGISNQQGETFTIRFGTNIFKTILVEELIPGKKVVWKVTDALIDIQELKNKSEWINTEIEWNIYSNEEQTRLHLTHFDLTPQIACSHICIDAWHSFTNSLIEFLNSGEGKPFKL